MLKNHVNIFARNLLKHKSRSAISIVGLSVGIACSIVVVLYLEHENGYNLNHKNSERLYRVIRGTQTGDGVRYWERTSGGLGPVLQNDYPEVEQAVRIFPRKVWIKYGERIFRQRLCLADKNILDTFTFPLTLGVKDEVFKHQHSILITQELSEKLFSGEDPIGKSVTIEENIMGGDYTVVGVLKNMPAKATLKFDILSTTVTAPELWGGWRSEGYRYVETYVLLRKEHDPKQFESKLSDIILLHMGSSVYKNNRYYLQPLKRIHLYSNQDYGIQTGGDVKDLRASVFIAGLVLLIVGFNFVNLATASAMGRVQEIGIRKTVGALRRQLIGQFLSESLLISFAALIIAFGIVQLIFPAFSAFMNLETTLPIDSLRVAVSILGIALSIGILAGIYPAFVLSAFQPVTILKGTLRAGPQFLLLRKILIVAQFAISAFLMLATVVVHSQWEYMKERKLGFDKMHVIELPIFFVASDTEQWNRGSKLKASYNVVKQAFLRHPSVLKAATSRFSLGQYSSFEAFYPEGATDVEMPMHLMAVDEDFLDFFGLELVAGSNFTRPYAELSRWEKDERNIPERFIVNERLVNQLGWTDPIGKKLEWKKNRRGAVVGVIRDFHFESLHGEILPLVLVAELRNMKFLYLKVARSNFTDALAFVEDTWKQILADRPFTFSFLDEKLERLYREEQRLSQFLGTFAVLGILLACSGLFGLATFIVEQRTREMAIRRTVGASVWNSIWFLIKDFLILVLVADLIISPISYVVLDQWLQNFAYRIDLGISPFLSIAILTAAIAMASVGFQSLRAARVNVVDSLRYS